MNRKTFSERTLLALAAALGMGATAFAGPTTVSFQGRLTDSSNNPINNGAASITFTIHDASSGGSTLWTEVHNPVSISNGAVDLELGSSTPIPDSVAQAANAWLQVVVGGETLLPRQKLMSVLYSRNAELLGGTAASGYVATTGAQGIAGAKTFTSSVTVSGTNDFKVGGVLVAGSGAQQLTNAAGKIQDAALSTNVSLLNANETVSGIKTFTSSATVNAAFGATGILSAGSPLVAFTNGTGQLLPARVASGSLGSSVIASSIAMNSIYTENIVAGEVGFDDITNSGCSTNDILKWDGSTWGCATDLGSSGLSLNPSSNQDATTNNRPGVWLNKTGNAADDIARFDKNDAPIFWIHPSSTVSYGAFRSTGSLVTNNNLTVAGTITAGSGSTVITNSAGSLLSSALTGNLPATVIASSVAANAVTTAQILNGTLLFADIAQNGCGNDDIIKWNGSAWACGTDAGAAGTALLVATQTFSGQNTFSNSTTISTLTVGTSITLPAASIADAALSANVSLLGQSITPGELDRSYIELTSTLQSGATFYVSSGTVNSLSALTLNVNQGITLSSGTNQTIQHTGSGALSINTLGTKVTVQGTEFDASGITLQGSSGIVLPAAGYVNFPGGAFLSSTTVSADNVNVGRRLNLAANNLESTAPTTTINRSVFGGSLIKLVDDFSSATSAIAVSNCTTDEAFVIMNTTGETHNLSVGDLSDGAAVWVLCTGATTYIPIR